MKEIVKPKSVAKKIEINDTDIVYPRPDSRKFKFEDPILLNGEMAYQPHVYSPEQADKSINNINIAGNFIVYTNWL